MCLLQTVICFQTKCSAFSELLFMCSNEDTLNYRYKGNFTHKYRNWQWISEDTRRYILFGIIFFAIIFIIVAAVPGSDVRALIKLLAKKQSSQTLVFLVYLWICLLQTVISYETRCPDYSQRRLMSKMCSSVDKFHCLYEGSSRHLIHMCRNWEWMSKGYYPVLSGLYIDYVSCSTDTYQPFAYPSYEDYECQLKKSFCNEIGQVTVDIGTTTNDSICRCDHTKGYAFVSWSVNSNCGPFEDDCSCYIRQCASSETLNKDYNCRRQDSVDSTVREGNIELSIRLNNTIVGISALIYKHKRMSENRRYIISGIISLAIIFIIVTAVPVACCTISIDEIYKTGEKGIELECTDETSKRLPQVAQRQTELTTSESYVEKTYLSEQTTITINLKRLSSPVTRGGTVTIYGSLSSSDNIRSVKWQVQGTGNTTLTLLSVKYVKDRKSEYKLQESVKYISSSDSNVVSLIIKNVESADEGMYSCLVSTQHMVVQSNQVKLTVEGYDDPNVKINPSLSNVGKTDLPVVYTQKTVDVKPGITGEIPCKVESMSKITSVTWHKHVGDGIAIIYSSTGKYTCKIDPPSLIISNVDSSDEGMYSCDVTNMKGTAQSDKVALNAA